MRNLADDPEMAAIRNKLDEALGKKLEQQGDEFLPGMDYIAKWGYPVNGNGTVSFTS